MQGEVEAGKSKIEDQSPSMCNGHTSEQLLCPWSGPDGQERSRNGAVLQCTDLLCDFVVWVALPRLYDTGITPKRHAWQWISRFNWITLYCSNLRTALTARSTADELAIKRDINNVSADRPTEKHTQIYTVMLNNLICHAHHYRITSAFLF